MTRNRWTRRGIDARGLASAPVATLVVVVLLASCIVVVAASGLQIKRPPTEVTVAWGWLIRFVALAAVGGGVVVLARQRRSHRPAGGLGSDPTVIALRTAATIMVLLAIVAPAAPLVERGASAFGPGGFGMIGTSAEAGERRSRDLSPAELEGSEPLLMGQRLAGIPGQGVDATAREGSSRSFARRAAGPVSWLIFALIALVALRFLARRQRRRGWVPEAIVPLPPVTAEAVLEASLDEVLTFERDPGCQVTTAYLRLLDALSAAGVPKAPQEAPHEHLSRALGPGGVPAAPLHRLAGLYVLAHFGGRPLSDHHRVAAKEALEASLASIRAMKSAAAGRNVPAAEGGRA